MTESNTSDAGNGTVPQTLPGQTGTPQRRFLESLGLVAVVLAAGGLRLWGIGQNGHGNPYYAAAVRSMLASGANFAFGAFDPAGFITVDKPPVAVWVQALSAAAFGFSAPACSSPRH